MCGTPRAAMTLLAHLVVAAAVLLAACVAAAPASGQELEDFPFKDATTEAIAVDLNIVNDLRAKPVDIPVEIIEDSRPAIKTNEVAENDEEIKRPSIDLRNPGPPQRQEHETQNADNFLNVQQNLLKVRDTIVQTQDLLRKGFQGVSDDIANWLTTNEQVNTIQQNIQSLRDTFTLQIEKLHEVVNGLAAPQPLKTDKTPESLQTQSDLNKVETSIQILENNFNKGVRALSEGVSIVAILRAEDANNAGAVTVSPPLPVNPLQQLGNYMSDLQNTFTQSISNITTNIQNLLSPASPAPPAGVLADTPAGTPSPANNPWPTWFPNLSTVFNRPSVVQPPSGQPASQTSGPIQGTFQSLTQSFMQGFQDFGSSIGLGGAPAQPPTNAVGNNVPKPNDEKQQEGPTAAIAAAPSVSVDDIVVAVPPADTVPAEALPAAAAPAATAAPATAAPVGPIQQILANNPVVQSLASTVQRIQSSINNPERPRDTENKEDSSTKGGYLGGGGHGHRPNGGDNNIDSGLKKQEIISEENKKEDVATNKEPEVEVEKTE